MPSKKSTVLSLIYEKGGNRQSCAGHIDLCQGYGEQVTFRKSASHKLRAQKSRAQLIQSWRESCKAPVVQADALRCAAPIASQVDGESGLLES